MEAVVDDELIYGINSVREVLKRGDRPVREVLISKRKRDHPLKEIVELARGLGIRVREVEPATLSSSADTKKHQGVVALIAPTKSLSLTTLIERAFSKTRFPVIALLDEIQDPGNLGSIIRSAEVLGVDGVVVTRERSAGLSSTVLKRSAGALAHIPLATVTNLNQAIASLKERGFWVVGIEAEGTKLCWEYNFDAPAAVVIGSEGKGVRRLVKKNCDEILSIPMKGAISSLNAASAATIIFYEILRQRTINRV